MSLIILDKVDIVFLIVYFELGMFNENDVIRMAGADMPDLYTNVEETLKDWADWCSY